MTKYVSRKTILHAAAGLLVATQFAVGLTCAATSAHAGPTAPVHQVTRQESAAKVVLTSYTTSKAQLLPTRRHCGWRCLPRNRAMNYALHQAGKWYCWGGTGPSCYDCSGLVYMAYGHIGISLPRTTYGMLASPKLVRVYHPMRGDLAFFGSGHVELMTDMPGVTFGAHDSGSRIGHIRWGGSFTPSAFYRVVRRR